ncbi:hypothetical protein OROHE_000405 [Orobanche hederae]
MQYFPPTTVVEHLKRNGFVPHYEVWDHHGETTTLQMDYSLLDRKPRKRKTQVEDTSTPGHVFDDQMERMVFNAAGAQFEDTSTRETEAYVEEPPNREVHLYNNMSNTTEVNMLYPPEAGRALTTVLRSKRALPGEGGEKWSTMSNSLKGYYFQELKKKYYFPHKLMNELWYTFNTVCCDKYKNLMNKVKVSGKKPTWMEQPEYDAWLAYWHRTDVEDVSYKNSKNRLSVPADGKGVAKHHFGSEAVVTVQVRALDKGEEKTLYDFFKRAKLNAKGAYVDQKSAEIAAAVESRIVDQDLSVEAINKIFLEVNPPDDKSFIYGLGSLGVALFTSSTSSSQGSRSRLSEERLREELAKRDAEYLKLHEEQRLFVTPRLSRVIYRGKIIKR